MDAPHQTDCDRRRLGPPETTIRHLWLCIACGALATWSGAQADYIQDWNAGGGGWQYWVEDPTGSVRSGRNKAVQWSANSGVNDSGHIRTPLDELLITFGLHYPAYMAPPDPVDAVDLRDQAIHISVNDFGSASILPSAPVHFFIGEWNTLNDHVFFVRDAPIAVGSNTWRRTTFEVGTDAQWSELVRVGSTKQPHDLYLNPQQWGFALVNLPQPPTGLIGFDALRVVPEPLMLHVLAVGGLMVLATRRIRAHRNTFQKPANGAGTSEPSGKELQP